MKGHRSAGLVARTGDAAAMTGIAPRTGAGRRGRAWKAALGSAVLALVVGCSPAPTTSPPASTASGQAGSQGCAWPREIDAFSSNALLPDSAAAYWIDFFTMSPGLRIAVSGTFPDARYASLEVYAPGGVPFTRNGVPSTLTDYQITPDEGSTNPWQQQAAPGGHYTVSLRENVGPGQVNALPIAPEGISSGQGLLVYRVYLPAGADFSKVALPSLTIQQDGQSQVLAPCTTFNAAGSAPESSAVPTPAATQVETPSPSAARPAPLQFFEQPIGTLAPNTDTSYVLAYVVPPGPGDVVMIRAKAPTHAAGSRPSPWPDPNEDVRYWSMCMALATGVLPTVMNLTRTGSTDAGCRADDQVKLDGTGVYAFVLGTETQGLAIGYIPNTTFLPFSAAQPSTTHLLVLRHMLTNPSFVNAPGLVTQGGDPATTEAVMGPYYPRATVCPLSTLVAAGVAGCLK